MPNYLKLAAESALSVFGIRSQYEQPKYEVVEFVGAVEVRRYAPRFAAQTTVEAVDEATGRDEAFKILAGYIFGANRAKRDIAMTAPVETARPRDIAMTTPVQGSGLGGRWTQRFYLPSDITPATAPEAMDERVKLVQVPEETVAALMFAGSGEAAVEARKRELLSTLEGTRWRADGDPFTMFYDPPFTIPFLRRNEVAVRVEPLAEAAEAPSSAV